MRLSGIKALCKRGHAEWSVGIIISDACTPQLVKNHVGNRSSTINITFLLRRYFKLFYFHTDFPDVKMNRIDFLIDCPDTYVNRLESHTDFLNNLEAHLDTRSDYQETQTVYTSR